jgi:hypothetical protein
MRDSLLRPSSDERLPCRPARTIKLAGTTRFDPTARLRSLAGGAAARLTRSVARVAVLYLYVSQPRSSAYECTVGQTLLVPLGLAACLPAWPDPVDLLHRKVWSAGTAALHDGNEIEEAHTGPGTTNTGLQKHEI